MSASADRLERLLAVTEAVVGSLETQAVMDAVIAQVSDALRAEACSLLLRQEDSDLLYFQSASGRAGEAVKEFTLPIGEGLTGAIVDQRHLRDGDDHILADGQAQSTAIEGRLAAAGGRVARDVDVVCRQPRRRDADDLDART